MKFFIKTAVLILTISALSCSKSEKDTQAPFIKINLPKNHDNLSKGNIMTYYIEFSDDYQLKNYKINIHSSSLPIIKSTNLLWDTTINSTIGGVSAIIKTTLNIPLNIDTGNYLFIVICSDNAGNKDWVARDFKIHAN